MFLLLFFLKGKLTKNGRQPKKLPGDYLLDVSHNQMNESGKTPKRKNSTEIKTNKRLQTFFLFSLVTNFFMKNFVWRHGNPFIKMHSLTVETALAVFNRQTFSCFDYGWMDGFI